MVRAVVFREYSISTLVIADVSIFYYPVLTVICCSILPIKPKKGMNSFICGVNYPILRVHRCPRYGLFLMTSRAVTNPEISEGGTPGPGTVSCPV